MREGRMPAQSVDSRAGENTLSSTFNNIEAHSINLNSESQQWTFGNRCGHVPFSPTVTEFPKHHKRRFPALEQAKSNLLNAYHNPMRFPIGRMFYNSSSLNDDGSYRQRRSELREALTCRIGQVILHCVNLANMALGKILPNGTFSPFGLEYIAKIANTTKQRVKRALDLFIEFGYVTLIERKYVTLNGLFRSEMPIIGVLPSLFTDLEISPDDLARHQKKQDDKSKVEQAVQKNKENEQVKKSSKKTAKKAMKQINEILGRIKAGKTISKDEKEYLDQEMPGYNRTKEKPPQGRYRDYTGCSKDESPFNFHDTAAPVASYLDKIRLDYDDS